ncbi:MAG TPA: hypothetical protein VGO50_18260 [Pyrinomonadaceae bacterium]|jgi:hypothetical protein|nr:hypothetical protein [Pyrinomonadaceae bacterium]
MSSILKTFGILSLILLFLSVENSQAQKTITTSTKSTVSSKMFLLNTAERKVSLELTLTQDTALSKSWKPQLNIYSYGKSLQYLAARNASPAIETSQVRFFADGREFNVESRYYFYMRESNRSGASISFQSFQPQISGPKVLDESGKEVSGFLGEVLGSDLTFDSLPVLNQAKTLEVKIGAETFNLSGAQLDQLREAVKDAR